MAIDGGARKSLKAGTRLVGTHRKATHTADVIPGEDGKLRFRLEDGREFRSPSGAGSAVMGGVACNGWRFWSLAGEETPEPAQPAGKPARRTSAKAPKRPTRDSGAREPDAATEPGTEAP